MRFDILTLHPSMLTGPLDTSILGRARAAGLIEIAVHDIRDYADNKHKTVDDAPYGGGAGMLMRVDVVARAIEAVRTPAAVVLLTSPSGEPFVQARAEKLATVGHLVLVCGHYEGIDARVEAIVDGSLSLGDFVLTGGEIAAAAVVDAVARLIPGVLGNASSPQDESFARGLLEYPQFTRPREWRGREVPEVLLSGHHERIAAWRREQAAMLTKSRRPDLWEEYLSSAGPDEMPYDCRSDIDDSPIKE
jgi:tRNA (guanine37-N1)-methyltransferase